MKSTLGATITEHLSVVPWFQGAVLRPETEEGQTVSQDDPEAVWRLHELPTCCWVTDASKGFLE